MHSALASAFSALTNDQQMLVLAVYAHLLTIDAREFYKVGTEEFTDSRRIRRINEVQHRVTDAIVARLKQNLERYPDDVLLDVIGWAGDDLACRRFQSSFRQAWRMALGRELEN